MEWRCRGNAAERRRRRIGRDDSPANGERPRTPPVRFRQTAAEGELSALRAGRSILVA
jgi:hypothetical protein